MNRIFKALVAAASAAVMLISCGITACADDAEYAPRLVDDADILSESEETSLLGELDSVSENYGVDVVIATTPSLDGKTATEYADDYYDYNGYGYGDNRDGILFLLAMDERKWAISTCGAAITYFTDAGQKNITDAMLPDLSDGNYRSAFETYITKCDKFIAQGQSGKPYDVGNMPKTNPGFVGLIIAIVIGLVVGLIVSAILKSQMKSVVAETRAANYVVDGSFNVTRSNDIFLYRNITRTKRPEPSSSGGSSVHTSSSGSSHGGSSGSF